MTAPSYFVGNPDYTGFLLHHCVHAMDLVPWLMGEPVISVQARRYELEPGKLLLHVAFGFASGALATVVMGTHQSRGTPMEWWQVMGDHSASKSATSTRCAITARRRSKPPIPPRRSMPRRTRWSGSPTSPPPPTRTTRAITRCSRRFVARVGGQPSDAPEIGDGVRAMRVLEAMMRSVETGATVSVQIR